MITREEADRVIDEGWNPVQAFKTEKGLALVNLHVISFDEKTGTFVQTFAIGGYPMWLFGRMQNGKMEYTTVCDYEDPEAWFGSYNLNECINKARDWFAENR